MRVLKFFIGKVAVLNPNYLITVNVFQTELYIVVCIYNRNSISLCRLNFLIRSLKRFKPQSSCFFQFGYCCAELINSRFIHSLFIAFKSIFNLINERFYSVEELLQHTSIILYIVIYKPFHFGFIFKYTLCKIGCHFVHSVFRVGLIKSAVLLYNRHITAVGFFSQLYRIVSISPVFLWRRSL